MKITIIGAGPGGYETAIEAAKKGIEVTVISDGPLGGTCLNEGCIPTKVLCAAVETLEKARRSSEFISGTDGLHPDFPALMKRKEEVVHQLRGGVEFLLNNKLITLLHGRGTVVDGHTVKVALAEGGETEVVSDYIIVATGSVPAILPVPGNDLPGVITSTELLSIPAAPSSLAIIGGGVIGLEFASVFAALGTEVTVIEYFKDIIPRFDGDISSRLKRSLTARGIRIETSAKVESIESAGEGLTVSWTGLKGPGSVTAEKVLMAVGRRPNPSAFGSFPVEMNRSAVAVNGYMQTSVPTVYAIGDVTGGYMLAHVATFQGKRVINHILAGQPASGPVDGIRLDVVPAAVFTLPEAATVGKTGEECKAAGIPVKVHKAMYGANGKAVAIGEPEGFCKIIVSEEDGRILGCHILGAHASDLIHEAAALMNAGATLDTLRSSIHAHPTLSEILLA